MQTNSEELKNYIESVMNAISQSGVRVSGTVQLEIAVVNTKQTDGGVKILVASAEGKLKEEEISKIKFSAWPKH